MNHPISQEAMQEIADCVFAGRKIEAIKLYREQSGQGLKEAKEFIEALEAELREKKPDNFTSSARGGGCLSALAVFGLGSLVLILW